jgi:hypothetical protein
VRARSIARAWDSQESIKTTGDLYGHLDLSDVAEDFKLLSGVTTPDKSLRSETALSSEKGA